MNFLIRVFAAFCMATIIAQLIILGIMAAKGNLHHDTMTQALALVNGIDVTGANLEKVVKTTQEQPLPTHEEVLEKRAMLSQVLQLQQDALARERDSLKKERSELEQALKDFDARREEFFTMKNDYEKKKGSESLQLIQKIFEDLAPDQAKEQLTQMLAKKRMEDVVAIIKVMSPAKRKKILGEFADQASADSLHGVLIRMLEGDPVGSTELAGGKKPADNP